MSQSELVGHMAENFNVDLQGVSLLSGLDGEGIAQGGKTRLEVDFHGGERERTRELNLENGLLPDEIAILFRGSPTEDILF